MNELPSPNDPSTTPPASPPTEVVAETAPNVENKPAVETKSAARASHAVVYVVLLALAVGLAALWWMMQNEVSSLRQEVGRRLHISENLSNETKATATAAQDQMKELRAKISEVENKQLEAQGQWVALEQIYQDLSKTRDDWVLAEAEQVLSTAAQQLQLAGNVRGAMIALQNAEARLSQYDNEQFVMIRRAIAKDLETLQALPTVDLTAIALRLDSAISRVDEMPLLADERPSVPPTEPKPQRFAPGVQENAAESNGQEGRLNEWLARLEQGWHSLTHELWTEVRQIVQVRKVGTPDALLLSPTDAYFARENLKLRLLNARLALLSRNEAAFRSDLIAAQETIAKYFDTRAKQTQVVLELLKQIQGSNLVIEMPTLAESLNAVRAHKAKL